ncbi:hypothetical protein Barb4_03119 [Bacteroidales bacterium Barb4]|nr:hypothetical protein Barb4_03119 [Bacteroidales bacterium Barb4]
MVINNIPHTLSGHPFRVPLDGAVLMTPHSAALYVG